MRTYQFLVYYLLEGKEKTRVETATSSSQAKLQALEYFRLFGTGEEVVDCIERI